MDDPLYNSEPVGWPYPKFSLADCRKLDRDARSGAKSPHDVPALDEAKFGLLHWELNNLAEMYRLTVNGGPIPTLKQRRRIQESIAKSAADLLVQFGVDVSDRPDEYHQHHHLEWGIFDLDRSNPYEIISSIQDLVIYSRMSLEKLNREIDRRERIGIVENRQQADPFLNLLYVDLASIFSENWAPEGITVSVNQGKGGPSIRFLQATLEKIVGRRFGPQTIKDAISGIRNGTIVVGHTFRPGKRRGI